MRPSQQRQGIPTKLTLEQFNAFILPHLTAGKRGPSSKLTFFKLFNYILKFLYTGCQWKELPIEKNGSVAKIFRC